MSEETTNYGIPNTTLDTEQYPPQTGDLLGAYVARLARTVVELDAERKAKSEEPSAYQRSLEAMIERWEARIARVEAFASTDDSEYARKAGNAFAGKVDERLNVLEAAIAEPIPDLLAIMKRLTALETLLQERYNGHDALRDTVIRIANHVGYDLHPQRETSEPTAEQYTETHDDQSHVTGLEQTAESVCTTCGHRRDDHKEYATGHGSMWACDEFTPVEPVCKCGHAEADHIEPAGIHICLGGTLGKPCLCRGYKPVAMG